MFDGYVEKSFDVPTENMVKNGKGAEILEKDGKEFTLECTWENNKKNGEGILLDSDGVIAMKLNFKDDLIEGEGILYQNGMVTFKGTWVEGKRNGKCQEFVDGHRVYEGSYENDKRNGYGIEYDETGVPVFEGEWKEGQQGLKKIKANKNGKKELIESDEDGNVRYIGGFKEGTTVRDGEGVEYDASGNPASTCIYKEGIVERRIKEFKGNNIIIYDDNNKKVYEGEYKDDALSDYPPSGKGRLFEDGVMVYNGEFKNGKRWGHGCSYYKNRVLMYDGDWVEDKANGNGKFNNEDGLLVLEGEFVDNVCTLGSKRVHVDTGKVETVKEFSKCCF